MTIPISDNDQAVLDLIRNRGPLSVGQFVELLGVTATAVRQRLSRLTAQGLLERTEIRRGRGRGRPAHKYALTQKGHRAIGNNFADFARVLWAEVQQIDEPVRGTVIKGVIRRLCEMYEHDIDGDTVDARLQQVAQLFTDRRIPFVVASEEGAPALKIVGCPYPELAEGDDSICELEQQIFSQLAQVPLDVNHCQCEQSGGACCSFTERDFAPDNHAEPENITIRTE